MHDTLAGWIRDFTQLRRSPLEALDACERAIHTHESNVRAWQHLDLEHARRQAELSTRRHAQHAPVGPLDGLPIGVKDIYDVAGMPTSAGAQHASQSPPQTHSDLVHRLTSAGAIVLGKTVTTPYAWIDPPPTRNPWNLQHTPGGSSSGSAAAVAAGMCLAALGSQTGGSITRPAAFCGVAGLKPTFARLSTSGIVPLAPSLDHPGLIARTALDLSLLWKVLNHSTTTEISQSNPPRISLLDTSPKLPLEPDMLQTLDALVDLLRLHQATISTTCAPASFNTITPHFRVLLATEAAQYHQSKYHQTPENYPTHMRSLIEEGLQIKPADYRAARQHQSQARAAFEPLFQSVDAFLTPAALGAAPLHTSTGNPACNIPWSYLGLPTVSIPIALATNGLPLAAQLVGAPNHEERLLTLAAWCEQVLQAH